MARWDVCCVGSLPPIPCVIMAITVGMDTGTSTNHDSRAFRYKTMNTFTSFAAMSNAIRCVRRWSKQPRTGPTVRFIVGARQLGRNLRFFRDGPFDGCPIGSTVSTQLSLSPNWMRPRASVNRGRPFGEEAWVDDIAEKHGLWYTMRPVGRPRKKSGHEMSRDNHFIPPVPFSSPFASSFSFSSQLF